MGLASGEIATISTGWPGTCSTVTITSTNGWDTNFDNLVLANGAPPTQDTDGDGCSDARELQTAPGSQATGGLRDPDYVWDFMDQYVGVPPAKDRVVSAGDIGSVVGRYGSTGDETADPLAAPTAFTGYHSGADRLGSLPGQYPWSPRPADGAIAAADLGIVIVQYGHSCAGG
jgi:hypothetical protein